MDARCRPAGRDLFEEFAAALARWEWDVALLQEVPPWWPALLAIPAHGDRAPRADLAQFRLPALRRALAMRWPDLIKSNGGGCNAILVRCASRDRRTPAGAGCRDAARAPMASRSPPRGQPAWVANVHLAGAPCGSASPPGATVLRVGRACARRARRRFQPARGRRWTAARMPAASAWTTCLPPGTASRRLSPDFRSSSTVASPTTSARRLTRIACHARGRPSSTISGGALAIVPAANGGSGSYSIPELDRLRHLVAGDVRGQPERHVDPRRDAGGGDHLALLHDAARDGLRAELGAARPSPASGWSPRGRRGCPAAASSSEPVHTDVVHCESAWARRSQSRITASCISARVPNLPGTTITSGRAARRGGGRRRAPASRSRCASAPARRR